MAGTERPVIQHARYESTRNDEACRPSDGEPGRRVLFESGAERASEAALEARAGQGFEGSHPPHGGRSPSVPVLGFPGGEGEARAENRRPQLRPRRGRHHALLGNVRARHRRALSRRAAPGPSRGPRGRSARARLREAPPETRDRGDDLREGSSAPDHVEHRGGPVVSVFRLGLFQAVGPIQGTVREGSPALSPALPISSG